MNDEKPKSQIVIVKSIVVDDTGKILFVKRDREWHKEAHNKWEFPGGKINFEETPEDAIIRETKEETGYNVKVKNLMQKSISSKWDYGSRESHQILFCYICSLIGGEKSSKDHSVSDVEWFTLNEALNLECLPGTIDFLNEYSKNNDF